MWCESTKCDYIYLFTCWIIHELCARKLFAIFMEFQLPEQRSQQIYIANNFYAFWFSSLIFFFLAKRTPKSHNITVRRMVRATKCSGPRSTPKLSCRLFTILLLFTWASAGLFGNFSNFFYAKFIAMSYGRECKRFQSHILFPLGVHYKLFSLEFMSIFSVIDGCNNKLHTWFSYIKARLRPLTSRIVTHL